MSRTINQNTEPLFIFDMPDDETLSQVISVKGEKGERGDPTKLSQLENDEGFIDNTVDNLTNYYDKTTTDDKLGQKLDKTTFNSYEIPSDFFTGGDIISGTGTNISLLNTAEAVFKSIIFYGDTNQNGTPSANSPVDIDIVTGSQTIIVTGDVSSTYSLDLGDIDLCELGEYRDRIYNDGQNWYLHRETGHAVIDSLGDGSNYSIDSSSTNTTRVLISQCLGDQACYSPTAARAASLCNHFVYNTMWNVDTSAFFTDTNADLTKNGLCFRADKTIIGTSSTEVEAWLNANPIDVRFVLASPVDTLITDKALISQLNAIRNAKSQNGTTIITTSGSLPVVLSVEAFKNTWGGTTNGTENALDLKANIYDLSQRARCFDSVAEMKDANLNSGEYAVTAGYYAANDGGGALYKIRVASDEDVEDEAFIISLSDNTLNAELIVQDNKVSICQIGGRSQAKDGTKYDIASIITKYINYRASSAGALRLYIPSGVYHSSPLTIICEDGLDIIGDPHFNLHTEAGTIISAFENNQDYIWTFGDDSGATQCSNLHLSGLMFTTAEYVYNNTVNKFKESSIKLINDYCVKIVKTQFSKIEDVAFQHINGTGLVYRECWEVSNVRLNFRDIYNPNKGAFVFENKITSGCNTMYFDWLQFEQIIGHAMYSEYDANVQQLHFDNITFEDYTVSRTGVIYTNLPSDSYSDDAAIHYAMIYLEGGNFKSVTIDSLVVNNMGTRFTTFDNTNHCFDTILNMNRSWSYADVTIGAFTVVGQNKDNFVIRGNNITNFYDKTKIAINNFSNASQLYDWIFDVKRFPHIKCGGDLKATITGGSSVLTGNNGVIPCGAIAAYELVPKRQVNSLKSYITGDKAVLNGANLAAEVYDDSNSLQFALTRKTGGFIRAKIPDGLLFRLYIGNISGSSPSFYKIFPLTGTGKYEYYELDFSDSSWYLGCPCFLSKAANSTADNMMVDFISI